MPRPTTESSWGPMPVLPVLQGPTQRHSGHGPHPGEEGVLVPGKLLDGVAVRPAGGAQHVGFVHELGRVDGHAVVPAQRKDLFRALLGFQGSLALCRPLQLATEISSSAPTALQKSSTPIHCSLAQPVLVARRGHAGAVKS